MMASGRMVLLIKLGVTLTHMTNFQIRNYTDS